MNERIEKKLQQIEKTEKLLTKYGATLTDEQKANAISLARKEWDEYCGRNFDLYYKMDDFRRTNEKLNDLKAQLERIQKQEEKKADTKATINEMPESMKEFAKKVEDAWNRHDKAVRQLYKNKYKELGYGEFIKTYKYQAYKMMHTTDEEFEKANHKAMETLIINLLNRVIEKTGKITDSNGLMVTQGNNGYAVINGFVKGEKGTAVVESIGAGGYNIQKYHIRTLVK